MGINKKMLITNDPKPFFSVFLPSLRLFISLLGEIAVGPQREREREKNFPWFKTARMHRTTHTLAIREKHVCFWIRLLL